MKNPPFENHEQGPAVDVLIESDLWRALPEAEHVVRRAITFAATSVAGVCDRPAEVSVLLCDDETISNLNARWRGQHKPTNVLSFPAAARGAAPVEILLGDIVIAYETLAREAEEQGKTMSDHLSHLLVHGFLHLLGHDHHIDHEAERMERMERDILAQIGVSDPYAACDADI